MDPDSLTRSKKTSSFLKLYGKIAAYSLAVVFGIITVVYIIDWNSESEDPTTPTKTNPMPEVLAEADSLFESGGVVFGIPTNFTAAATFGSDITVAQDTNLEGDLYYRGDLVDLSIIVDGLEIDSDSLSTILDEGVGISITGDEVLQINNTGVLSFNGLTGDVVYEIEEHNMFKNILVPGNATIVADSTNDSLTFIPGDGISLATDATGKSITITSSSASSGVNTITGIPNQVIVTRLGQDVILSLPQDFHTAASVTFSEMTLADPITSANVLSFTSSGRISTLNNADLLLGSNSTGNIQFISKGATSLLLNGSDLVASGSLTGVTDFSASGEIELTSLANGIVQAQGYTLTSGPINLASSNHVSGILSAENGGTGTDKTPLDGQILIGSGHTKSYEPRHLSVGTGISVTRNPYSLTLTNSGVTKIAGGVRHILVNGSYSPTGLTGDVTLTLPQILDTVASPTFAALRLTSHEDILTFTAESGDLAYLQIGELTQNRNYTLPDESGTFCLTSGNCVGIGGGLVGTGTANYIPKYSNANTLTPSLIYDDGSSVGVGTTLPLLGVALDVNGSLRIGVARGTYDILNTVPAQGDPLASLFWGDRTLCDSSGSCQGTAGAGVESMGTDGYIALFSNSGNTLANSLIYDSGSAVGIGTTTLTGFITISGSSENSALSINQTNSVGDIISASIEGEEKMILTSVGDLDLVSGVYKNKGNSGATVGGYSCVTTSGGIVTGSGACPVDPSATLWESQGSLTFAKNTNHNFALGGTTVNNAKFAVLNIDSGDPTIWLRSSPTQTLSITSSGTFKTINDANITLESGEDIVLKPGSGDIVVEGKLVTPESSDLIVEPEGSFHVRPHGQQVLSVSTDGVGVNTTISRGAFTIKELSSFPTQGEGEGTPDNNLILDPADSNFSSNTGHWTLWSGWSISGGRLTYSGGIATASLENQYIGNYIEAGKTYTVKFDLLETTSPGAIGIQVGNAQSGMIWADMPPYDYGTKTSVITPTSSGNLHIYANNGWQGSITNIRITSPGIEPPPSTPPSPDPSGPGLVLVSSDGALTPLEMRAGGSGLSNTFVGYSVGGLNESGTHNAGFGAEALYSLSLGDYNTAIGSEALYNNLSGLDNVALGYKSGYHLSGGSGNVFVGSNAGPSSSAELSNQLYIANAAGNPLIWGDFSEKMVGINLADTTSANNTLSVAGSLCVTATGVCENNSDGTIYTTNTVVTGADVAENYVSAQQLHPGDVVSMANNGNSQAVVKAHAASNTLLGVVSTAPGLTLNSDARTDKVHKYIYPIALNGRVPTNVSTENGLISVGDPLTVGSTPGVAVKAINSGYIIGRALESYSGSGTGTIIVYANAGWYAPLIVNGDGNIVSDSELVMNTNNEFSLLSIKGLPSTDDTYEESLQTLDAKISGLEKKIQELEKSLNLIEEIKNSDTMPRSKESSELLDGLGEISLESASIAGSLRVEALYLDGNGSISTQDTPLRLQANSTHNIVMFDGSIIFAANGDISTSGTVKAKKIDIDTSDEEAASIGVGTIKEGEKSVTVNTKAVTEKSNIFITPKTLFPGMIAVTEQTENESFKVEIEKDATKDILFNWWIVN